MINFPSRTAVASALLLLVPLCTHSQELPELLKPVEQAIETKLQAKTNYGFRMQKYFAKRYRIVDVDFALLANEFSEFTITPFPDLQVKLATKRARGPSSEGQLTEWVGEIDHSEIVAIDDRGQVGIPNQTVFLWVRTGEHEVPLKLVQQIAAERGEEAQVQVLSDVQTSEVKGTPVRMTSRMNLRTLSGQWYVLPQGKEVVIRPIEDDPRYHIIYEVDPEKKPSSAHETEESRSKLRALQQFREQIDSERASDEGRSKD